MGFADYLYALIKYGLLLAVLAAIALAALFLANQHIRAQRKQKAQEKTKYRQSLKAEPAPAAGARPAQVLVSAPSPSRQSTTPAQPPTHRVNASNHSIDLTTSSSRQSTTTTLNGSKPSHRASMLIQNTKAVFSTLTHKDEDAKPLASQIKRGMRKRLASFKVKQAPKIKEQMSNLGFETSFNPLFEAGFAKIEDMVFEDPDIEVEQQQQAGGIRKFGTMKRQSKAMAAPVLAGAYAMDTLPSSKSKQEGMHEGTTNPAFDGGEEEEVIWLEGEIAGKRCWEDIDTGIVVEARPTEGTITNQTTLDTMMSEGTDAQGNMKFSSTYEEMRKSFKVSGGGVSRKSSGQVHYVDYEDDDNDSGQEEEDLEEIRQLDHGQNNAMMQMLGS